MLGVALIDLSGALHRSATWACKSLRARPPTNCSSVGFACSHGISGTRAKLTDRCVPPFPPEPLAQLRPRDNVPRRGGSPGVRTRRPSPHQRLHSPPDAYHEAWMPSGLSVLAERQIKTVFVEPCLTAALPTGPFLGRWPINWLVSQQPHLDRGHGKQLNWWHAIRSSRWRLSRFRANKAGRRSS